MEARDFRNLTEAYYQVYEGQELNEAPFQIYGPPLNGPSDSPSVRIGKPYQEGENPRAAKNRARRRAEKLNQEIGGHKYTVHKVDEATKAEKHLGLTPKERAERRDKLTGKDTKRRQFIGTQLRDISPKKQRADIERQHQISKKEYEKKNPGKRYDQRFDHDDDYDDYYDGPKDSMANVPRTPEPKPGRRKPLGANAIRRVQPYLQFSRARAKRKEELNQQRKETQRAEREKSQKNSDDKWKTMMSIDDVEKRRKAPANRIVRFNREEIEYLISHLLDEGYANTPESAEAIMENMSETWMSSILESSLADMFSAENEKLASQAKTRMDAADRIRELINKSDSVVGKAHTPKPSASEPPMSSADRIKRIKAKLDDAQAKMDRFDRKQH
jgi:hypothetical protein